MASPQMERFMVEGCTKRVVRYDRQAKSIDWQMPFEENSNQASAVIICLQWGGVLWSVMSKQLLKIVEERATWGSYGGILQWTVSRGRHWKRLWFSGKIIPVKFCLFGKDETRWVIEQTWRQAHQNLHITRKQQGNCQPAQWVQEKQSRKLKSIKKLHTMQRSMPSKFSHIWLIEFNLPFP